MTHLGKQIKLLRARREMSLQDVAALGGMTKAHVHEMEHGSSNNPKIRTLCGLAYALGVPPASLVAAAIRDHRKHAGPQPEDQI